MNILKEIVNQLNKEEVRLYKIYASRTTDSKDRKDILLFDMYRKTKEPDDEQFFLKLYNSEDKKNVYYRLKNRLIEDINKVLFLNQIEVDDIQIHYLISIYRYYYNRNQFRLARYYLKKAEKEAEKSENFPMCDIIYSEFIKLSRYIPEINPEILIKVKNENFEKLELLRKIDEVLALVSYKLSLTQNLSQNQDADILETLQQAIDISSSSPALRQNRTFRFKVYQAVSRMFIQKHDYESLTGYIRQTLDIFKAEKLFDKKHHEDKISMHIHLMNALNLARRNTEAIDAAEALMNTLKEFDGFLYDKFAFFYYNGLINAYSELKKPDLAIELLEEMQSRGISGHNPTYEVFVMLNLAICRYEKREVHLALKQINRLYISEAFSQLDETVKFKIHLAELMMRFEKNDFDSLEYRISQVSKDFTHLIQTGTRDAKLFDLLRIMTAKTGYKNDEKARVLASELLYDPDSRTEFDLIDYKFWIRNRFGNL